MKVYRLAMLVLCACVPICAHAWQEDQYTYDVVEQSIEVLNTLSFATNNDETQINAERDIPMLHLSNLFSLESADFESFIDADLGYGGSVEIRVYLYNPINGLYDELLWGAKKDGNGITPTQTGIDVLGGVDKTLVMQTDSEDFETLLLNAVPALESSLEANRAGNGVLEHYYDNMLYNILTYNGLLRPLLSGGELDDRSLGYSYYSEFGGWRRPDVIELGYSMASVPVHSLFVMPGLTENDLDLKLGANADASNRYALPFLGLQKVRVEMDVTNAKVRSFTLPHFGKVKMGIFEMQNQKLSFLHVDRNGNRTNPNTVLVSAHRGYWRTAPPNSLSAMDEAIAKGSQVVEFDLNKTKDGEIILMHDRTINRTTNYEDHTGDTKNRNVSDLTLAEIKELTLVDRFGKPYTNSEGKLEKVPTLEEALEKLAGRVVINVDKYELYFSQVWEAMLKTKSAHSVIGKGYKSVSEWEKYLNSTVSGELIPPFCANQWDDPTVIDPQAQVGPGGCPARVGDRVLGETPAEKLDFMINSVYFTPILNDWVVSDNHSPSYEQFIDEWTQKEIVGFETMPESMNSPVWKYMRELREDYMVGTFSPFADTGEGHSMSKGRAKFDQPFVGKTQWDMLVKNGSNFLINDRSGLLDQYIEAIYGRNTKEGGFANMQPKLEDNTRPLVVAHRAAWVYAQENSLDAMRFAINTGAEVLEMDVRITLDKEPAVIHDSNLKRVTSFATAFQAQQWTYNGNAMTDIYGNALYKIGNTAFNFATNFIEIKINDPSKKLLTELNDPNLVVTRDANGKTWVQTPDDTEPFMVYTQEVRHWAWNDIKDLFLLDRYENISAQNILHLKDLLTFLKGKAFAAIDKWNQCKRDEVEKGTCSAKEKLSIILKTAEEVGALGNLIVGSERVPDGMGTGPDPDSDQQWNDYYIAQDYYTPQKVLQLLTIDNKDYWKQIGSWLPKLNDDLIRDGQDNSGNTGFRNETDFVDQFLNFTYTDESNVQQHYPVHAFFLKVHDKTDIHAAEAYPPLTVAGSGDRYAVNKPGKANSIAGNLAAQHTQETQDKMRKLITHLRAAGKHVYMAAHRSTQVMGKDYTDEVALLDVHSPTTGWLGLLNLLGLKPTPDSNPNSPTYEPGPGATMIETNYPMELLRLLREMGLHN